MVEGKKILVVGLANKYSIAASICDSLHENGAELAFSYQNERFEKFISDFAKSMAMHKLMSVICQLMKTLKI